MITIDSKIKEVFEELELSYTLQDDKLEVSTYSPEGQDCSTSFKADCFENLLRSMAEWVSDFDVDAEAALWIGDDGHGKNGAPYHIKDIVEDMEWWHKQIDTLHDRLVEIDQEREYTYEYCPYCETECEFIAVKNIQVCPSCGKHLVVCSMCECSSLNCALEKQAEELNRKNDIDNGKE